MKTITIVVPFKNIAEFSGVLSQNIRDVLRERSEIEYLLVNDNSSDSSEELLHHEIGDYPNVRFFSCSKEDGTGPGAARNIGIEHAYGEYIVFQDADDALSPVHVENLLRSVKASSADIVAFDWERIQSDSLPSYANTCGRNDLTLLEQSMSKFLQKYIELRLDGSVIYNCYRREFLKRNKIKFRHGIHEDIDFAFKTYRAAREIVILRKKVYQKRAREGSIVNTFSELHVRGFIEGIEAILKDCMTDGRLSTEVDSIAIGIRSAIATRLRELVRNRTSLEKRARIRIVEELKSGLVTLVGISKEGGSKALKPQPIGDIETQYEKAFHLLRELGKPADSHDGVETFIDKCDEVFKSSWSCRDLHSRLYFRAEEVRTCCKRFFRNGKMEGDVSLKTLKSGEEIKASELIDAKKRLHSLINSGSECECSGCPFLEFREWGEVGSEGYDYISVENHSVCNLRCSYCSDEYYGGKSSSYDLKKLLSEINERGEVANLATVVWGGGEPVLGRDFEFVVELFRSSHRNVEQRFLSNSVIYSECIANELRDSNALLCTSIDAGSPSVYKKIRGRDSYERVLDNLSRYIRVASSGSKVVVKYILDEGNMDVGQLKGFTDSCKAYGLTDACVQISSNFKEEAITANKSLSILYLYGMLYESGFKKVFLDDLITQRLDYKALSEVVGHKDLSGWREAFVVDREDLDDRDLCIWGLGKQAESVLRQSSLVAQLERVFIVVDNVESSQVCADQLEYIKPEIVLVSERDAKLLADSVELFPLAVQGFSTMMQKLDSIPELRSSFKGRMII